jgi:hypothetical protein
VTPRGTDWSLALLVAAGVATGLTHVARRRAGVDMGVRSACGGRGEGALVASRVRRPLQRALGLPGADRRFTGSYDAGSFTGNAFPSTVLSSFSAEGRGAA